MWKFVMLMSTIVIELYMLIAVYYNPSDELNHSTFYDRLCTDNKELQLYGIESLKTQIEGLTQKLKHIQQEKDELIQRQVEKDDWFEISAKQLVRERIPAGDYVHKTKDKTLCGQETLKMLIVINTKYHEWKARQTIRNTWAKEMSEQGHYEIRWRYLFVMSSTPDTYPRMRELLEEKEKEKDILDIDLFEHVLFDNMKLYGLLTWAMNSCRFENLLYIHANYYVNIPQLYNFLHEKSNPQRGLYAGHMQTKRIEIPRQGERHNSKQLYENKTLSFISEGPILLSFDVIRDIIPSMKTMKELSYKKTEHMIALACSGLHILPWNVRNFVTSVNCTRKDTFILNRIKDQPCFQRTYQHDKSKNNVANIQVILPQIRNRN